MKRNNKTLFFIGGTLLALLVAVSAVTAYFVTRDSSPNEIKIPQNVIGVSETFDPPDEQTTGDNIFRKTVSIKNTGGAPCFVRVYADFSDSFARSRSFISDGDDPDALNFFSAERIIDPDDGRLTFVEYVNRGDDWSFVPDDSGTPLAGYYYYKSVLPAGSATPPLFTYIKTVNESDDDIDEFDITVYSESVQTTAPDGTPYSDYTAAWTDRAGQ